MTNPLPIKITDLSPLSEVANNDVFLVVDRSDTSISSDGKTKNVTTEILKNYVLSGFSFGSVNNHSDITISGASNGQLLRYNSITSQWENFTPNYLLSTDINLSNLVVDEDFTSTGLMKRGATSGAYSVITDNSTNWNTAHGWGNHASAGYLTIAGLGSVSINALSDVDTQSNAPANGQVLTWSQPNQSIAGKWVPLNPSGGGEGGSVTLSSFSVGANNAANGGGGLAYANSTGVFTYTPPDLSSYLTTANLSTVSINALNDVNTQTTPPTNGQFLAWNGTNWVPTTVNNTPTTGLQPRSTRSGTLTSLVNNNTAAQGQLDIADVAKTYSLMKIQTSHAAWVTLYTNDAKRDADVNRSETTDPLPGSGIIAEVITTGAQTQIITPGVLGWNDDATPGSTVYAKVVNKSGSSANVTVTLTFVPLEA